MKMRVELKQKTKETNRQFLEKYNKAEKPLARVIKKE